MPSPLGLDGISIAPLLRQTGEPRSRDFLIHEAHPRQSIIRGRYKLIRDEKSPLELYDLFADPNETTDIAAAHSTLVADLEELLLGERVAEPRGFANTYHHWIGANGTTTSDAANWSDYHYTNAGITYQTDTGAPQLSWIAHLHNSSPAPATARADQHLEFLALEISGQAEQQLVLDPQVNLLGRNEIRLSRNGKLTLQGGTVTSLRWIEIEAGASLAGHGTLDSDLYTQGTIAVSRAGLLHITGTANLGGSLTVPTIKRVQSGDRIPVLQAQTIRGKFEAIDDRFNAEYTPTSVTLVAK